MKILALVALGLALTGGAAIAQPQNGNHNHGGPAGHGPAGPAAGHAPAGPAAGHGPARPAAGHAPPGPGAGRPSGHAPGGHGASNNSRPGPGAGGHGHRLPPGIRAPSAHHRAPVWSGHSWAVGEFFALSGFTGPTIRWSDYGLPPAHPGTHWIYVDGWYLMVGNRTGRIIDEVPADY